MKDDEPYDQFDPVHHRLSSEEVARFSAASKRAPSRRHRSRELFARVPNDRALALYHHRIGEAAWQVLFELDRAILKSRGKNPVELQSDRLVAAGMTRSTLLRALRRLVSAGVIQVETRPNRAPMVTHSWHPTRP
jgi:hypothetical protein